jgi:hypothetical protein
VVCVGVLGAVYFYFSHQRTTAANSSERPTFESPAATRSKHPMAKHLELSGFRVQSVKNNLTFTYVVINHSGADLPPMKLKVTIRSPSKAALFEFPADVPAIGPFESREITTNVKGNFKPYELPDWQMIHAEFDITSEP